MRRYLPVLLMVLVIGFAVPQAAFAAEKDITIAELSNAAEHLDHQQVTFDGEAVGDIINADAGNYWVTLNDGTSSISVYIDAATKDSITRLGTYGQRGTMLEVNGEFNLACDQHDGLSDVHAHSTKVLDTGGVTEHQINPVVLVAGGLLIVAGLALSILYAVLRKRKI